MYRATKRSFTVCGMADFWTTLLSNRLQPTMARSSSSARLTISTIASSDTDCTAVRLRSRSAREDRVQDQLFKAALRFDYEDTKQTRTGWMSRARIRNRCRWRDSGSKSAGMRANLSSRDGSGEASDNRFTRKLKAQRRVPGNSQGHAHARERRSPGSPPSLWDARYRPTAPSILSWRCRSPCNGAR